MKTRLALLLATLLILAPLASRATESPRATFQVGAATADLTPLPGITVYSGGFGTSPPLTNQNILADNLLNARAIYVGNGAHSVAMVVVDSQGLFAAVQKASADPNPLTNANKLGIDGMRADAAAAVSALDGDLPDMAPKDIIIQGSHSHSAPTAMGIWGPVDDAYLQQIHDRVVTAIVQAATNAEAANLQYATVNAPWLDNVITNQTDSYQGWTQDEQVSVLRAVSPSDGSTITTFANVPAHPDIVNGAGDEKLTADYFGETRRLLEEELGGTGIVGGATLGREESPIQVGGIDQMRKYGRTVAELITRALTYKCAPSGCDPKIGTPATWVTDDTIDSAETFIEVPATNPLLTVLNTMYQARNFLPPEFNDEFNGEVAYPINRSTTPPYATGNFVGTSLTALRIGGIAYISLNGEAFPEVRHSIERAVSTDMLVGLSLGQDQLGYYEPAHAWAFANGFVPYHSDHLEYNVSPVLGDEVVHGQVANLLQLGFDGGPAVPLPEDHDYAAGLKPGIQALASPERGDAAADGTFTTYLEAIYGDAAIQSSICTLPESADLARLANDITHPFRDGCYGAVKDGSSTGVYWSFGDGTTKEEHFGGRRGGWFAHTFPDTGSFPRTFHVTLTTADNRDRTASWSLDVVVYPHLTASVSQSADGNTVTYTASAAGGQGNILAYRWTFSDGSTASGQTVTHAFTDAAPGATVTVTDGTGTTAMAIS
ncbi:MAG: PKD domain-containing protein [Actinomycetota bacterium]|nr:hypothetical protein [Actinomycetota bacterium]